MRSAILFTTYAWDGFVARQYERLRLRAPPGDLFAIADETRGPIGSCPVGGLIRVAPADVQELVGAVGYVESGPWGRRPLLWWNLDYLAYHFFRQQPAYDYCLALDFDAAVNLHLGALLAAVASRRLDLVAALRDDLASWSWSTPHHAVYPPGVLRGASLAIAIISRRAATYLARRRAEMAREYRAGRLAFWPFCEAFVPTELAAIGFRMAPLSDFGDTTHYRWRPAHREADVLASMPAGFVHPIRPEPDEDVAAPYRAVEPP